MPDKYQFPVAEVGLGQVRVPPRQLWWCASRGESLQRAARLLRGDPEPDPSARPRRTGGKKRTTRPLPSTPSR
ncbi:MAG: hypothetical protein ACOY93_02780 [Bacillota bacterium]